MPLVPTRRQQEAAHIQRWTWIAEKLEAELNAVKKVRPKSFRVPLLRRMLKAAKTADEGSLMEVAREYVRRTRVLPPGVYAQCFSPGKTFYLDGERLEPGRRVASLTLAAIHAQVYR